MKSMARYNFFKHYILFPIEILTLQGLILDYRLWQYFSSPSTDSIGQIGCRQFQKLSKVCLPLRSPPAKVKTSFKDSRQAIII